MRFETFRRRHSSSRDFSSLRPPWLENYLIVMKKAKAGGKGFAGGFRERRLLEAIQGRSPPARGVIRYHWNRCFTLQLMLLRLDTDWGVVSWSKRQRKVWATKSFMTNFFLPCDHLSNYEKSLLRNVQRRIVAAPRAHRKHGSYCKVFSFPV